jgi:hypothetical protein
MTLKDHSRGHGSLGIQTAIGDQGTPLPLFCQYAPGVSQNPAGWR